MSAAIGIVSGKLRCKQVRVFVKDHGIIELVGIRCPVTQHECSTAVEVEIRAPDKTVPHAARPICIPRAPENCKRRRRDPRLRDGNEIISALNHFENIKSSGRTIGIEEHQFRWRLTHVDIGRDWIQ